MQRKEAMGTVADNGVPVVEVTVLAEKVDIV
jgi:hypothetical protein